MHALFDLSEPGLHPRLRTARMVRESVWLICAWLASCRTTEFHTDATMTLRATLQLAASVVAEMASIGTSDGMPAYIASPAKAPGTPRFMFRRTLLRSRHGRSVLLIHKRCRSRLQSSSRLWMRRPSNSDSFSASPAENPCKPLAFSALSRLSPSAARRMPSRVARMIEARPSSG